MPEYVRTFLEWRYRLRERMPEFPLQASLDGLAWMKRNGYVVAEGRNMLRFTDKCDKWFVAQD